MDSLNIPAAIWSLVIILPVILIAALCIRCRRRIPTRIPQSVDNYNSKRMYTTPPSFAIIGGSHYPQRTLTSPTSLSQQHDTFLMIPRSPAPSQRRSSSLAYDGAPGFRTGSDSGLLSVSLAYSREEKAANDDDDYEDDGNYSNENYNGGYIQVIPNESDVKVGSAVSVVSSQENRASMSSVTTDDNYVNVEDPSKARAASSCANDDNYVNVGDQSESEDARQSECLEYVNVEDSGKRSASDSEDEHDYENVESRKSLRSQKHSS